MTTSEITQPETSQQPYSNKYVRFAYGPQKICYYNQGQVSGSIKTDLVNENTDQQ